MDFPVFFHGRAHKIQGNKLWKTREGRDGHDVKAGGAAAGKCAGAAAERSERPRWGPEERASGSEGSAADAAADCLRRHLCSAGGG